MEDAKKQQELAEKYQAFGNGFTVMGEQLEKTARKVSEEASKLDKKMTEKSRQDPFARKFGIIFMALLGLVVLAPLVALAAGLVVRLFRWGGRAVTVREYIAKLLLVDPDLLVISETADAAKGPAVIRAVEIVKGRYVQQVARGERAWCCGEAPARRRQRRAALAAPAEDQVEAQGPECCLGVRDNRADGPGALMTCFGGLLTRRADGVWVWSDGTEELRVYDWDGGPPPKPSDRGVPCYLIPPLTDDGACWFWKADEPAIIAKAVELGWYIDGVAEIEGDPWEGADERLPSMDEIAAEVRRVYGRRGEA